MSMKGSVAIDAPRLKTMIGAGCPRRLRLFKVLLRYRRDMTGLLEEALRRVESLSPEEQDAIASQILETLEDEEAWERSFRERPDVLRSLESARRAPARRDAAARRTAWMRSFTSRQFRVAYAA